MTRSTGSEEQDRSNAAAAGGAIVLCGAAAALADGLRSAVGTGRSDMHPDIFTDPSTIPAPKVGSATAVVEAPEAAIAGRLAEGETPRAAVLAWIGQTAPWMPLLRDAARVVTLDEMSDAALPENVADLLGLPLPPVAIAGLLARTDAGDDPAWRLVAVACLAESADGAALAEEISSLAAGARPLEAADAAAALQARASENARLREEVGLLRENLADIQQELERLELEERLSRAAAAAARKAAEIAAAQAAPRESVLGALVLDRMAEGDDLREEAEALRARVEALSDEAARASEQAARVGPLEAELAAVYGATSWRITAPLRAVGRALGRGRR